MTRFGLSLCLFLLAACRQEMADMPRHESYEPSAHFADGKSARPPVPGTVARSADLSPVPDMVPGPVTMAMLRRGQERFNIYCAPCHGIDGQGAGIVVQRGFPDPPSYFLQRLVAAPDRHFYDVITDGYGAMYSYAARVNRADRWAIVAYIRALQFARSVPVSALPDDLRARLEAER